MADGSLAQQDLATVQLRVGGMSCSFCSESIRKAIGRLGGVVEVHVSLAHEEALVRYAPHRVAVEDIEQTLRDLGYVVRDPARVRPFEEQEEVLEGERRRLTVAALASGAFVLSMSTMWAGAWVPRPWHTWVALSVAAYVLFGTGRRIVSMAWGAARRRIANQHVLLTAGAVGGLLAGLLGTPVPALGWTGVAGFPPLDFYGVVVFLTTYHLLSGYVALRVRARASRSVRKLLDLRPSTARVVRGDGEEEVVAVDEVRLDDRVRIRPGERIAVDGRVLEGRSAVDESLVTGESVPSAKIPGQDVIGGSMNGTGTLLVVVTRTGQDTFLRRVARHVEEAKALKPGVVAVVDRVLKYYVPVVFAVALGALVFWSAVWAVMADGPLWPRAIYAALSVLVMGYPCALGMATPLALIRGGGAAAERGILMRSGEAFQVLKDIDVVVMDKTGTLTRGALEVVEVTPLGDLSASEVVGYAAAAEQPSEHPLARAVVDHAEASVSTLPSISDFDSVPGSGVWAQADGRDVHVGTGRFLAQEGIRVEAAEAAVARAEDGGRTAILVAVSGRLVGVISLADTVKDDDADAVAAIRALGLRPVMLTGDAERTARAVAEQVGIERVRARVLPGEKAEHVHELQREGSRVAFVGDGINDAPALMQADVGIAIGAGTDIAIESSDVVLVGNRLSGVVEAYHIGHTSYRKTVQNLWLAFLFNGVGVPLAATGIVHPTWAMVAMAASVSAVLANSFGGRLLPGRPRDAAT